nr:JAB domain-containing protein [Bacteroidota bacterium]
MNYSLFTQNISEVAITYHNKVKASQRPKITCSGDSYQIFSAIWDDNMDHIESFYAMFLNRANALLGVARVAVGGTTGTIADPKVIYQLALKVNAQSIIVSHNHPSGNLKPSDMDEKLTRKLKSAGTFLDICFLDHLILTSEAYYSFADEGNM